MSWAEITRPQYERGGDWLPFAWLDRCRRLAKNWENAIASAESWLVITHIRRVLKQTLRSLSIVIDRSMEREREAAEWQFWCLNDKTHRSIFLNTLPMKRQIACMAPMDTGRWVAPRSIASCLVPKG